MNEMMLELNFIIEKVEDEIFLTGVHEVAKLEMIKHEVWGEIRKRCQIDEKEGGSVGLTKAINYLNNYSTEWSSHYRSFQENQQAMEQRRQAEIAAIIEYAQTAEILRSQLLREFGVRYRMALEEEHYLRYAWTADDLHLMSQVEDMSGSRIVTWKQNFDSNQKQYLRLKSLDRPIGYDEHPIAAKRFRESGYRALLMFFENETERLRRDVKFDKTLRSPFQLTKRQAKRIADSQYVAPFMGGQQLKFIRVLTDTDSCDLGPVFWNEGSSPKHLALAMRAIIDAQVGGVQIDVQNVTRGKCLYKWVTENFAQANGEQFKKETLAGINPRPKTLETPTKKKPAGDRVPGADRIASYGALYDLILKDVKKAVMDNSGESNSEE